MTKIIHKSNRDCKRKSKKLPFLIERGLVRFKLLAELYAYNTCLGKLFSKAVLGENARRYYKHILEHNIFYEILFHFGESVKPRRRRSERVNSAIFICLRFLLKSMNLTNMTCGVYDKHQRFHGFDYNYIQKRTGLSLICVKRSMKLLQTLGFCTVECTRQQLPDGRFVTAGVYIRVTEKLFELLDLFDELDYATKKAQARHREKREAVEKKQYIRNMRKVKQLFNRSKQFLQKKSKKVSHQSQDTQNKTLIALAHQYLLNNPGAVGCDALAWAKQQLHLGIT